MLSFWVLEHKKQSYAKVHKAECGCCKNGRGPKASHPGFWHGPFETYIEAQAAANKIRRYVDNCKLCKPESSR